MYFWDTRDMTVVEGRNNADKDEVTKKEASSRTKKVSTEKKKMNKAKKRSGAGPNSSTGAGGKSTAASGNESGGVEYGGFKASENDNEVKILWEGFEEDRKRNEVELQSFD